MAALFPFISTFSAEMIRAIIQDDAAAQFYLSGFSPLEKLASRQAIYDFPTICGATFRTLYAIYHELSALQSENTDLYK